MDWFIAACRRARPWRYCRGRASPRPAPSYESGGRGQALPLQLSRPSRAQVKTAIEDERRTKRAGLSRNPGPPSPLFDSALKAEYVRVEERLPSAAGAAAARTAARAAAAAAAGAAAARRTTTAASAAAAAGATAASSFRFVCHTNSPPRSVLLFWSVDECRRPFSERETMRLSRALIRFVKREYAYLPTNPMPTPPPRAGATLEFKNSRTSPRSFITPARASVGTMLGTIAFKPKSYTPRRRDSEKRTGRAT